MKGLRQRQKLADKSPWQTQPNVGLSRQAKAQKRQTEAAEMLRQGSIIADRAGNEWKCAGIYSILQG